MTTTTAVSETTEYAILEAYARYDGDQRVDGIDDYQAFRDALLPLLAASGTPAVALGPDPCRGCHQVHHPAEFCPTMTEAERTAAHLAMAPPPVAGGLFEELAAIQHEIWASWEAHLHAKGHRENDGRGHLRLPGGYVDALERLIATPYAELSDQKKEQDREQVRRFWPLVLDFCQQEIRTWSAEIDDTRWRARIEREGAVLRRYDESGECVAG